MVYNSDNSKVEELTGVAYSGSTTPTSTQVADFLARRYAEINSVLKARGYTVPATGSNDTTLLAHYEALGAAVLAEEARYQSNVDQPRVKQWREEYMAFLNRLRQGQQDLIDQDESSGDEDPYFVTAQSIRRDDFFIPEEVE